MKNIKFRTILALVLFTLLSLQSCDKAKQLEGTTWEGDCDFTVDRWDEKYDGTITISFAADDADVVAKFKVKDTYYGDTYTENHKATATYTCEKDVVTLRIKWKTGESFIDDIDDGKWSGTFDKTTMTLKNVFGETVRFKKS